MSPCPALTGEFYTDAMMCFCSDLPPGQVWWWWEPCKGQRGLSSCQEYRISLWKLKKGANCGTATASGGGGGAGLLAFSSDEIQFGLLLSAEVAAAACLPSAQPSPKQELRLKTQGLGCPFQ